MDGLINEIISYCDKSMTFKLFCIFILLVLLWLFIESAVSMGVRNGILHAENEKNRHYKKLAKKSIKEKSQNSSNSKANANLRKRESEPTSTNRDI